MTARELIEVLNKLENKELPIYVYHIENAQLHDFDLDLTLQDRIDINISDANDAE